MGGKKRGGCALSPLSPPPRKERKRKKPNSFIDANVGEWEWAWAWACGEENFYIG